MYKRIIKKTQIAILPLICMLLFALNLQANNNAEPEMADQMRADGKIYVVVVVLATIFAGIFTYLIYLDRKITRLEKENKN